MERYRIVKEIRYSGCIPIVVYCVQVRKDERLSSVLDNWVHGGDADCIIAEFEEKLNEAING